MERMGPGDLRIHFISILPCEIQISIFPICKMGIVIAPRDGQGLQSTI